MPQVLASCAAPGRHGSRRARSCLVALLATSVSLCLTRSVAGQTPDVREVVSAESGLTTPNFFSLAVDPAGNIFVGGANSSNVLRVAPRGKGSGAAGDGPCIAEIFSQRRARQLQFDFAGPKGIAIASNGDVYVAGTGGAAGGPGPGMVKDNVVRVSPDGTVRELFNRD